MTKIKFLNRLNYCYKLKHFTLFTKYRFRLTFNWKIKSALRKTNSTRCSISLFIYIWNTNTNPKIHYQHLNILHSFPSFSLQFNVSNRPLNLVKRFSRIKCMCADVNTARSKGFESNPRSVVISVSIWKTATAIKRGKK